jgi:outer membrane lipoprotein-sorting protein
LASFIRTSLLLAATLLPLSGCLLRTHKIEPRAVSTAPLLQASLEQLVDRINSEAAKVKSMNATVDIASSVGGEKKGKVTEYQEIRGYVLVRKPEMLRMIGLYPVLRNKAFDMVSDGDRFKLYIPTKNKFIVGSREVTRPSKQPLENLRPQHIMDALLVKEIDPKNEIAVLETGVESVKDAKKRDVDQANYIVSVAHHDVDGKWYLARKIYFSRTDLFPRKQVLYDRSGNVATIAVYENYSEMAGIMFPNIIQVDRPQEEYSIQLGMVKLKLNEPLKDAQFELAQPQGAQVVHLDDQPQVTSATPQSPKQANR